MAEKLYHVDRVWKTWRRALVGNDEGNIIIQKLMDIYETIMRGILSETDLRGLW